MKFTNKVYDVLKAIAMLYLPAAATLFYTLAQIWHWHHVDDVMGSITGVIVFLSAILKISTRSYDKTDKYDGTIDVQTTPEGKKVFQLNVGSDLDKLDQKEEIWFKVNPLSR